MSTAVPTHRHDEFHRGLIPSDQLGGAFHVHVIGEQLTGDGVSTTFYLANEADPDSVAAYNAGLRTDVTVGGMNDTITFTVAPAAAALIRVDYIAVTQ